MKSSLLFLIFAGLTLASTVRGQTPTPGAPEASGRRILSTELTAADVNFLRATNAALLEQQATARVAAQRATREKVKDFAASVQEQVQSELKALQQVARAQGVPLENHMEPAAMERAIALRNMDAAEVDSGFLNHLITSRSGQIPAFEKAMTSPVPEIRALAEAALTAIKEELLFIQLMSGQGEEQTPAEGSPSPAPTAAP